jgi:hypothetical protein
MVSASAALKDNIRITGIHPRARREDFDSTVISPAISFSFSQAVNQLYRFEDLNQLGWTEATDAETGLLELCKMREAGQGPKLK